MGCAYCHGLVNVHGVEVCAKCHKDRGAALEGLSIEVLNAYNLAAMEYDTEVLAGNEVKASYWRGELEALMRVRVHISCLVQYNHQTCRSRFVC